MSWDSHQISSSQINDLRHAAEQAWGDDTRHEAFIGHPQPSAGNCFVTAHWLTQKLGGYVGTKAGHYFWVSPDKRHVIDLAGDQHAYRPEDPSVEGMQLDEHDEPWKLDPHQKTWRPGPVMYKRADHPLYKGFRVLKPYPEHKRANQFANRANAVLRGERVASLHEADLMGPEGLQTPQQAEDWDMGAPMPMLHDEPDPVTDITTQEYKWVFANGQLHVSPLHSHEELFDHAGANATSSLPAAVGFVTVSKGHAMWEVESNVSMRGLHKILTDYSDSVGWDFDGMVGTGGTHLHDDFGPKKSMYYTFRKDGHLVLSESPLPHGDRINISGKTAYVKNTSDEGLQEWANDFGYKLAEWPGGGDMTDKMKVRENLDTYNRGDTDFQPERNNPDQDLGDSLTCGGCGVKFDSLAALRLHHRDHEPHEDEIQDGHFPQLDDFDAPLPFRRRQPSPNWGENIAHTVVMVLPNHRMASAHPRFDLYASLFNYAHDKDLRFYGAFRQGQLVGYGAIRLNGGSEPETFYHVAPASRAHDIERYGLDPEAERRLTFNERGIYLWDSLEHAQQYAQQQFGDQPIGSSGAVHKGEPYHIYAVQHDPDELYADPYRVQRSDLPEYEHSWQATEPIPSERLRRIARQEPEALMIDAVQHGTGIGSSILGLMQTHFDHFYTHADSDAGERLMRRMGMVNVEGRRWRWAKGEEPKDMIEASIPFIYDIEGDQDHKDGNIALGYPGQRTSDIPGKFTPGGIVEGYYEPGGKIVLISATNVPYTVRYFAQLWYSLFPQMEITNIELEGQDGKTQKLAAGNVGHYLRTLVASDQAAHNAYRALNEIGGKVYVVGGAIRDALQGRDPQDLDLMVAGLPTEQVAHVLGSLPGTVDLTGKRFGVYRYKVGGQKVEIALPRQDKYESPRRGEGVITVDHNLPIEKDLERRDFTANSMAVDLDSGRLIDPHGGGQDIESNILRTTHPDSFREDPTRIVRALAAHGRFGLQPDERTRQEMAAHGHLLRHESPDALNKVIDKTFSSHNPAGAVRLAKETRVLPHLFPEVAENWDFDQNNPHHQMTLGEHSLNVLDNVSKLSTDPDLRLAALYHDVGKPASHWLDPTTGTSHYYEGPNGVGADHALVGSRMLEDRMRGLNYPVARIRRATELVRHHMFPAFNSPRGSRKFLQKVGDHADDLLTLRQADMEGKGNGPEYFAGRTSVDKMRELVDQARHEQAPTAVQNLAINGNDLINMGMQPGPAIGNTLRSLVDHVVEVPTDNTPERLLELAQSYQAAQPS